LKLEEEVAKLRPANRSLEDEEFKLDSVACAATSRQALPSVDLMTLMIYEEDGIRRRKKKQKRSERESIQLSFRLQLLLFQTQSSTNSL